jgi:hypothetical protein
VSDVSGPQILEGHYIPQQNKFESGFKIKILIQLLLALFCVVGLVSVGYYFGRQALPSASPEDVLQSVEPINETPSPNITDVQIFPIPSTIALNQTISLALNNKSFTLKAPDGWKLTQETHNYSAETRISNDQYALIIKTDNGAEAASCDFSDSSIIPVSINGLSGQKYRRINTTANPSEGKSFFAICQGSSDQSSWNQPTSFGFITYEIPYDENAEIVYKEILATMDNMVANLKIKSSGNN